jgi:diketogulonate reductase-like aldo/keto reductase
MVPIAGNPVYGDTMTKALHPTDENIASALTLHHGVQMPRLGLGVWQSGGDTETERAVRTAIECGYRSIDTAKIYGNERGVGRAIRGGGVPREQLFVTTKVWNDAVRADRVAAAFDDSLRLLGLDYVDLYLVHWPIKGKIVSAWRALEQIAKSGRARAIGVSNHLRPHLDELLAAAEIVPAVNQIEFHPYLQSRPLVEFCRAKGIQVEAWSPLGQGGPLLRDAKLVEIARRHGKTVAQVILRWDLQKHVVTIPKSVHAERIAENARVFDFALSDAEIAAIDSLERGHRYGPDPANFGF